MKKTSGKRSKPKSPAPPSRSKKDPGKPRLRKQLKKEDSPLGALLKKMKGK
jgi:hypothetical protein